MPGFRRNFEGPDDNARLALVSDKRRAHDGFAFTLMSLPIIDAFATVTERRRSSWPITVADDLLQAIKAERANVRRCKLIERADHGLVEIAWPLCSGSGSVTLMH